MESLCNWLFESLTDGTFVIEIIKLANRVKFFSESVIRETTRLAQRYHAINLGQGMPDFETPQDIKDAACLAIQEGFNQYAVT